MVAEAAVGWKYLWWVYIKYFKIYPKLNDLIMNKMNKFELVSVAVELGNL